MEPGSRRLGQHHRAAHAATAPDHDRGPDDYCGFFDHRHPLPNPHSR
ncbi:hypothetical protein [Kitasatospora purpeofusca]